VAVMLLGRKIWLQQLQLAYLHLALGWSLGQHLAMLCERFFRACFLLRKWLERQ
jgi:hypothetical protein